MDTSCNNVEQLHEPRTNRLQHFKTADVITAQDIKYCNAIEQYAAISEHWSKCSPCAKSDLLEATNDSVRSHAQMFAQLLDAGFKTAAA